MMYIYNLGLKFEYVCEQNKEKEAIFFHDNTFITYGLLSDLSNKFANYFNINNIKKGDVIAVQNNKSSIGFAIMIACLKLGIIYTNFDYTNPLERIKKYF